MLKNQVNIKKNLMTSITISTVGDDPIAVCKVTPLSIGSLARDFHIGFDPTMNKLKSRDPTVASLPTIGSSNLLRQSI